MAMPPGRRRRLPVIKNVEPFVGECEHLQPGCRLMRGMWTAMDQDDDRTGSWQDPGLLSTAAIRDEGERPAVG